jgi:polysaccharide pyruvyl transferase WcaK-like protein
VVRPRIDIAADPALLLSPSDFGNETASEFQNLSAQPCAAIALRNWGRQSISITEKLGAAWKKSIPQVKPIPMPMHSGQDSQLCASFASGFGEHIEPRDLSLPQLIDLASNVPMVVGMRLHALIFATASSSPSAAISYDPKVTSFMAQTRQSDAVYSLDDPDDNRLAQALARVWDERQERRERLLTILPALRESAALSAKRAVDLLK